MHTSYKTLPKFGDTTANIRVIMGGDIGLNPEGREIFDVMSREPSIDLMVIGGDIAYDNAMAYCYYSWDNFYDLMDRINHINDTSNSRLVPFILAIGNHDIGNNGLAKIYTFPSAMGPWWFAYNPQHFDSLDARGIP
jgi:3',5'-cyclic AMP phosphodiesterase CpdA